MAPSDSAVLVTGANGFVGSHTVMYLESLGYRVVPADVLPRSHNLSLLAINTPTTCFDATDATAFNDICRREGVTHIVHLAYPGQGRDADILNFCVQAMRNILEAASELRMKRVVFASSGAVYGRLRTPRGLILESDTVPLHPAFLYRSVKLLGEWMGDLHAQHSGTRFVALRLASVYGPGVAIGMGEALKQGILGRPCRPYLTRSPVDDPIHASDAARAIQIACFCENPASRAYNIGAGAPCSDEDMARAIRRHLPELAFELGKHHDAAAQTFRQRDIMDTTLARKELGFVPEYDLDSGIAALAQWLRTFRDRLN